MFHGSDKQHVTHVSLIVSDIERAITFYVDTLGFKVKKRQNGVASLTVDGKQTIITLEQPEAVTEKEARRTGLYHFAVLVPTRKDLALVLKRLLEKGYPLQGASDHLVSEALYLSDPDGHGVEIYADRPSERWTWRNGEVVMTTAAIDGPDLLAEAEEYVWGGLPSNTVLGHIHLHVAELDEVRRFYTDGLGFQVVNSQYGTQVLFVSTNGYHHHVGLNIWNGRNAPKPSSNSVRMKYFTVSYPSVEEMEQVVRRLELLNAPFHFVEDAVFTKDPSGNQIELVFS
ncbi:VOC family protein [Radiobacillus deserti]|uniref:VOC family protein n=1 Tax=Radiobacillus deserti TaxID=2594883 RepID=A0A516KKF7_9BACI|nr:VOC family protein [Radiobacillus deserti]QDP41879.1 VOC family protein [Radiobacillus deserti]